MLFRSQNSESIVNLSKCISVSVKRDGTTTLCINGEIKDSELYSIIAKTENSGNIILGIYNNYESAKIAMNFIQNSNNIVLKISLLICPHRNGLIIYQRRITNESKTSYLY